MKQYGIVTSVEGETAKVLMKRHSSCGSCSACKMGQEEAKLEVKAINNVNAKTGEWVSVNMEDQDVLTAAFMVYVIPLLALLVGVIGGSYILSLVGIVEYTDIYAALIGFVTMGISFISLKKREGNLKNNKRFLPVITEIVEEDKVCKDK